MIHIVIDSPISDGTDRERRQHVPERVGTVEGDAEEEVDASGDEVAVHADRTAITQRSRR